MEKSIALFLFSPAHHDYEFVPIFTNETQSCVVMCGLRIELGFTFAALDPETSIDLALSLLACFVW